MKVGVVVFPGSNCDHDVYHVLGTLLGFEAVFLWHRDTDLKGCQALVLPGGFSYGDYLRCGAIARFSPLMREVEKAAGRGMPILGICNGFQILTEARLLPGALLPNASLKFICDFNWIKVESQQTPFTKNAASNALLRLPIAHGDGNYFIEDEGLRRLEGEGRVVFRYVDAQGQTSPQANPNGSLHHIAGVCNEAQNVVGLMPHPERVSEALLGSEQGRVIFESLLAS